MNSSDLKIKLKRISEKVQISYTNENYDFFCSVEGTLINLHRQAIQESELFQEKINSGEEICVLREAIDVKCLSKVLRILYGIEENINRGSQIDSIMKVVKILKIRPLETQILNDFMDNFEEYPLFTLLKIANAYDYQDLETKCLSKLQKENYEQINYEKFQFLQLPQNLFELIIAAHQQKKMEGVIQGFSDSDIRQIAQQYDNHNQKTTDIERIIKFTILEKKVPAELQSNGLLFRSEVHLRKKIQHQEEQIKPKIEYQDKNSFDILSETSTSIGEKTFQEKKTILSKLRQVNSKICEENEKMMNDITCFSENIEETSLSSASSPESGNIFEQLAEIEQISLRETAKISKLQEQMQLYLRKKSLNLSKEQRIIQGKSISEPTSRTNSDSGRQKNGEDIEMVSPPSLNIEDLNISYC